MHSFYSLGLLVVYIYIATSTGTIIKRELLQNEKNLFNELRDKLTALEKRLDSRTCKEDTGPTNIGSIYTRWGRTICPKDNTELVYSGYTGGSHYTHKGGAVEYLCMPKNPDWNGSVYTNGTDGAKGYVYGAEYRNHYGHIGIDKSFALHDVPCAVCRATGSSSVLMTPGKTNCEKSWTKQYSGYLMSGYHGHEAASQYICLDKDAETLPDTSANKEGKLLYPVEARCGSLPCPPYVEGRELACVVCSK